MAREYIHFELHENNIFVANAGDIQWLKYYSKEQFDRHYRVICLS